MKAVKIIGGIVIGLVIIVLVLGLIAPTHTHVERSVEIDAPIDFVRGQVNNFEAMEKWSPWRDRDPNQETTITNDGAVGALYHWAGNDDVGEGEQEITLLEENKVVTHLHFIKPFEAEADATISLEDQEGKTKVTWAYDAESPFPMNALGLFIDMDKMLGPDFQMGMDKLKALTETAKTERNEFNGFVVETTEISPRTYIGVRDSIGWNEMQDFFGNAFGSAYAKVSKAGFEVVGQPSGLYFEWNEESQSCELLAGIPVADGAVDGMQSASLSGKALLINYYGPYEGTMNAHEAMEAYMKWHGIELAGPVVEEYVTDPQTEPDPQKWLTKIMYPIGG